MDKPKILYLITLSETGGAQKYVFDLARSFKNDFEVLVGAGGKISAPLFQKLKQENINFYPLKYLKREINLYYDWKALQEIKNLVQLFQPDIVHLNSSKISVLGALAVKHKIKTIYTVHGFVFNEPLNFLKKTAYLLAEKQSAQYKDKIIVLNKAEKEIGINYGIAPKNKFVVIPNGIETENVHFFSKKEARQKLKLPLNTKIVGTVANYYKTKALIRLIKAGEIINQKFNKTKFVLIGDGPEKENLIKEIKKIGLINNFLLGPVDNAMQYLKAFDAFVLPSVKEGFPYTLLEAMLAEIPIISTNVGGISEIITDGENGFLIKSFIGKKEDITINDLAQKTIYILEHPEISKIFTEKAYRKLIKNFTLKKMIKRTRKVYFD